MMKEKKMKKNKTITNIDGILFQKMIINGAVNLHNNYHKIDNLNVFPVPDRDTGTNMKITMMSGVEAIKNLKNDSIVEVSQILSKALLLGAKGNSGVILSQFFAGMGETFAKLQKNSIHLEEFMQSLENGYKKAYQAIIKPTEGTILTVFRLAVEKTSEQKNKFTSIIDLIELFLNNAKEALKQTTNLLAVLKKAGVVDSGGAGFVEILKGWLHFFKENQMIELKDTSIKTETAHHIHHLGEVDIKYIYCTEYVFELKNNDCDTEELGAYFETKGDSLVLVKDEEILKIHIHTNCPGTILEKLLNYGNLKISKIDNMKEQHQKIIDEKPTSEKKQHSLIVFVKDAKMEKLLSDFEINYIIPQKDFTKEALLKVINQIDSPYIFIFPNNLEILNELKKNTILSQKDQKIIIAPSKNIAQTYSALLAFDPSLDWDQNQEMIENTIKNIQIGEIIAADKMNEKLAINKEIDIAKESYLSIYEGEVVAAKPNKYEAINTLLKKMIKPCQSFLTIFYNSSVTNTHELAEIEKYLKKNYDHLELEILANEGVEAAYILSLE
ncbi:DAK2 Domain Protein [Strawberry lethal yellows phytoplasma (CPA) str. NZSb11]|uniref:DAK2 Domain Protein n=2 Tax=Phytoplasma australiense TaxID=59748 RepID=R4S2D1_PHYAS|nr:DAK2 Domain Protein [Strawberry lethal yellows phytoplasma (CPA) str. NZSb11]